MTKIAGSVALVTGAGSGIGKETTLALARAGASLVLCDIDHQRLKAIEEEVSQISDVLLAEVIDVSDRAAMQAFANIVHTKTPHINILVNNAGIGVGGIFEKIPLEEWDRTLAVNFMGVVHGCHAFLPRMKESGEECHIVNIASMAAYTPGPKLTAYCATKAAVFSLSECLREELRRTPIHVSIICPGLIATNIVTDTAFHGEYSPERRRKELNEQYIARGYTPDRVATAILKAIKKNRKIVPVSPESWFAYYLGRISVPGRRIFVRFLGRLAGEK